MKERPVLFSAPMVRAILEDRKTQTRRFLKWPLLSKSDGVKRRVFLQDDLREVRKYVAERQRDLMKILGRWQVGDRLWVKEGWGIGGARLIDPTVNYRAGGQKPMIGNADPDTWSIAGNRHEVNDADLLAVRDGWQNAMFMPRWASRITLEITDVRVQRVQEITPSDSRDEGVEPCGNCLHLKRLGNCHCNEQYRKLWDSINGKKHPWSANPWVWAITFRRLP